jgi:hypothetical protein
VCSLLLKCPRDFGKQEDVEIYAAPRGDERQYCVEIVSCRMSKFTCAVSANRFFFAVLTNRMFFFAGAKVIAG